jgi:Ca2+-binding RTX toxin-like protein
MPFLTSLTSSVIANSATLNGQVAPRVLSLSNGRYVIVWQDNFDASASGIAQVANSDVRAQIFNADGTRFGSEMLITGNAGPQFPRSVIELSDGHLLFSWQDGITGATPAPQSWAQEFSASGSAIGAAFQIGGNGTSTTNVALAPLAGGGFVATWLTASTGGSVVAQRYDNNNNPVGSLITIDSTEIRTNEAPQIATLTNGNFVVSWLSPDALRPNIRNVTTQVYDIDGNPLGAEQSSNYIGSAIFHRIAATPNGGYAILMVNSDSVFSETFQQINVVIRNSLGEFMNSFFTNGNYQGNSSATDLFDSQSPPDFAVTSSGNIVVTWRVFSPSSGNGSNYIAAAYYTPDGAPIYPEGTLSTEHTRNSFYRIFIEQGAVQNTPAVGVLSDGNIVFAWTDTNPASDGSGAAIRTQLYDIDPTNRAPFAPDLFLVLDQLGENLNFTTIPGTDLTLDENDRPLRDLDGDIYTLTGVSNPQNGSVTLNPDGTISFVPNPSHSGPARFNYIITDSQGASSTGAAAVVASVNDHVVVRGPQTILIDVTANDYLPVLPQGQSYVLDVVPFSQQGFAGSPNGLSIRYDPLSQSTDSNNGRYFDLRVGQTVTQLVYYGVINAATGERVRWGNVIIELQGWAQIGGAGADNFTGTDQSDHLSGGVDAANILSGLGGDDWYTVQVAGDTIVEQENGGLDTVRTNLSVYTLPANVENLEFFSTSANLEATGNAQNNRIFGSGGNDVIRGLGGNDFLNGSNGNDTLYGDEGNDILVGGNTDQLFGGIGDDTYTISGQSVLVFENAAEGIDLVRSSANYYLVANIENLTLTGIANNFGVGNELDNVLTGNAGENLLIAGAGNDTVNGGGARDAIFGEDGADILNGEAGVDYIVGGVGNDSIDGGTDADELYGQDGDDIMRGGASFDTDIMVGGLGNDTIYGNGGLGDYDLLYGNQGNDVFYVDTPADLVFEQAGEGTDTVYADINGAGYYLYDNIENLVLLDDTPFGVGNALDNRLTGNAVGNYLLGGAGNDRLNGMAGNDVLFGEAGNDVFVFDQGTGGDVIGDFTTGQDRIDLSAYGLTFAQLQTLFAQNGNVGAIQFANGDVIVLHNVTMSQLTASDFILTPVAEGSPKTEADVMDVAGAFDEGAASGLFADLPYADSGLVRWQPLSGEMFV